MAHSDAKEDRKMIKHMVKPGALKMKGGGKTNSNMLKYGRNMAKIKAQRGG
jgi:hypothetical protein